MPMPTVCAKVKVVLVPTTRLVASGATAPSAGPAKMTDKAATASSAERVRFDEIVNMAMGLSRAAARARHNAKSAPRAAGRHPQRDRDRDTMLRYWLSALFYRPPRG